MTDRRTRSQAQAASIPRGYPAGQRGYAPGYGRVPQQPQGYYPQAAYLGYPPVQDESLGVGNWILTIIVSLIPVVNIVVLLIWSFARVRQPRKNFARAMLILILVCIAALLAFSSVIINLLQSY
jgi:hypothetical protein